jgi:hypothetical protein
LNDVVCPRRASLGQGFVEVEMMLKLNKHLLLSNPQAVIKLSNSDWEKYIPKRPYNPMENIGDDSTEEEGDVEVEQEDASNSAEYDEDSITLREGADDVATVETDDTPVEDLDDSQIVMPTQEPETYYDTQLAVNDSQETCDLLLDHSPKAKAKTVWIRKSQF